MRLTPNKAIELGHSTGSSPKTLGASSRQEEIMATHTRNDKVAATVTVEAGVERAFQVFTERCHVWWPLSYRLGQAERVDVVFEPRLGGRWYERTADGKECDWGVVLAWNPPDRISLSWQIGTGFVPEPDPQRASRVDVTFVAAGIARTTVTVIHSEFERHGEHWKSMQHGVSREGGWPGILTAYASLIAGGA
jgi:uncharacterized protein YndB with AHSA1/START domain